MKFEFVTRVDVVNDTYSRPLKKLITVLIAISVLVVIGEFFINNNFAWNFLIPIVLLFCAREQFSVKTTTKDVDGVAWKEDGMIWITLFHVIHNRKGEFNSKFSLDEKTCRWKWTRDESEFAVNGNGTIDFVDENGNTLNSEPIQEQWLHFYMDDEYAKGFKNLFPAENESKVLEDILNE